MIYVIMKNEKMIELLSNNLQQNKTEMPVSWRLFLKNVFIMIFINLKNLLILMYMIGIMKKTSAKVIWITGLSGSGKSL